MNFIQKTTIFSTFLLISLSFSEEIKINNTSRDCEEVDNIVECFAMGCEWNDEEGCYRPEDNDGDGWESECSGLGYEDCEYLDFCMWVSNDPSGDFGTCIDVGTMDDGGWNDDGGWEDECSQFGPAVCDFIPSCQWNEELEQCERDDNNGGDDGSNQEECADLSQDECTENEFCEWTAVTTPNGVFEMCTESNGWNDDGGWEDDCYSVTNPFECFALGCEWNQDEGCYEPEDEEDTGGDDGGDWSCQDINNLYECFAMGCDWIGGNMPGAGYCTDGGNDQGGDDGTSDGGDFECSDLGYEECMYYDFCEWSTVTTPNGVFEMCIDANDWNDDGGWDDCDPDLMCAAVITCFDGLLYPTSCGPENCDEPIGECDGHDDGGEDDGHPECLRDCEGIENVDPEQDGMYFCEWLLTVFPSGCAEDCEQEVLDEIEEFMLICDECLPDGTCDNYFGNDDGEDNCNDLTLDECNSTPGCQPNFSVNGEFEGCYETDNVNGCWNDEDEYFCVGCEWFINDCDYYDCTSNGWNGPFTLDDCPGEGDGGWFECSDFGYEECESNPDCTWNWNDSSGTYGYCEDNISNEAVLSLGNAEGLPGSSLSIPLYLYSNERNVGGLQFTISSMSSTNQLMVIPEGIESMNDCFTANFNNLNNQFLGIIFSLEGCTFSAGEDVHAADLIYYIPSDITVGSEVGLYFEETIVSDFEGSEIPSYGMNSYISVGSMGDVNSDGEINVLDVVMIVNFALYFEEPTDMQFLLSDVNSDGSINVLDVVLLVGIILED